MYENHCNNEHIRLEYVGHFKILKGMLSQPVVLEK